MKSGPLQNLLVVLLATASLATTALLVLTMFRRGAATPRPENSGIAESLEVRIPLPKFTLTERSGQPVTLESLKGKVWVADFVFTRCAGPCPLMSAAMAKLQAALMDRGDRDSIRLVSFSVDPTYDTPEVLREYADRFKADPKFWLFLSGARPGMWSLVKEGFKLPVFENTDNPLMPIGHSLSFVLVDKSGRIRGYYRGIAQRQADGSTAPAEMEALVSAVDRLLGESPEDAPQ